MILTRVVGFRLDDFLTAMWFVRSGDLQFAARFVLRISVVFITPAKEPPKAWSTPREIGFGFKVGGRFFS